MIATGFLSMWISNTATTVMMLPIALSVISQIKDHPESKENEQQLFGKALMLAVAYSASAGGIATLIGTPPNLIFAGFIEDNLNTEISFFQWFKIGLPISVSLIVIIWIYLTQIAFKLPKKGFPGGKKEVQKLLFEMGPMKNEEKKIMLIFLVTILCWISRKYIITPFIPHFDDSMIAITSAIFLFIIPSKNNRKPLLEWNEAVKIPWGILILFGGGLSIANGFQTTQIDLWIGDQLSSITITNALVVLLLVISSVNFITEMSSNMATTAMLLPIMIPLSEVIGVHPYLLLVSTTLAASCAFMLPVATPPNAVVFGSKLLTIRDMVKAGFLINVISIIIILIVVNYGLPLFWNL